MPASSFVSNPTRTLGSVCRGNLRNIASSVAGLSFAAQPAAFAMEVSFTDEATPHLAVNRFDYSEVARFVLAHPEIQAQESISQTQRGKRSAPADFSTSGGFGGGLCRRFRYRAGRLGRNFESILVHIKSLFPVQAFDKLACCLSNASRKTRRIHFYRRFHGSFSSILIAKLYLKRFHALTLPFLAINAETGSRTPTARGS